VLDPPERARVEIAARTLFGMLGDRLVVSLPGDGHVLFYHERADELERVPFAESELGRWTFCDSPEGLFELIGGRPPWPGGGPPDDLESRTRVSERRDHGRIVQYRVQLATTGQSFALRLRDGALECFEWWVDGTLRLEVRYDRWRALETERQPARLRLRVPQDGVVVEVTLEDLMPRRDLSAADFEVY
jgi:hypothetical protein